MRSFSLLYELRTTSGSFPVAAATSLDAWLTVFPCVTFSRTCSGMLQVATGLTVGASGFSLVPAFCRHSFLPSWYRTLESSAFGLTTSCGAAPSLIFSAKALVAVAVPTPVSTSARLTMWTNVSVHIAHFFFASNGMASIHAFSFSSRSSRMPILIPFARHTPPRWG